MTARAQHAQHDGFQGLEHRRGVRQQHGGEHGLLGVQQGL